MTTCSSPTVLFGDRQRTIYSGRLHFGQPADVGVAMSRVKWGGALFLPDSHACRANKVVDAVVSADFWIQATHEYMFVPTAAAGFAGDPSP